MISRACTFATVEAKRRVANVRAVWRVVCVIMV
jgi:hypothetical protein